MLPRVRRIGRAAAYLLLKAVPDGHTAMLYSVSAIMTYGRSQIFLADNCRLLGAVEALGGPWDAAQIRRKALTDSPLGIACPFICSFAEIICLLVQGFQLGLHELRLNLHELL